jgi:short-subunit dehydrogenase involved in D-alanine esterification of teichoic acids
VLAISSLLAVTNMAARINTVLVIGGTAGIGEQLVRRFHGLGKKVIVTGRNQEKLKELAEQLIGLETRAVNYQHPILIQYAPTNKTLKQFDITDITSLTSNAQEILTSFPTLDTIVINAGIQKSFSLFDPTSISATSIALEISTNLTAPALLVQAFAPHLLSLALQGTQTTLFITSSSLAYVPLGFYPTYCASKAGIHALALALRQQLGFKAAEAQRNMRVVEIVPPYTDTGLDREHREAIVAMQGGPEKAFPAMPLNEFVDGFFQALEQVDADGGTKKEIGVGFGQVGVDAWRGSLGKVYEGWGLST